MNLSPAELAQRVVLAYKLQNKTTYWVPLFVERRNRQIIFLSMPRVITIIVILLENIRGHN